MGTIAVIDELGKIVGTKNDSWPTVDCRIEDWRFSYRDTVYAAIYEGIGFTMTLGSATAEVKVSGNPGIYLVEILGKHIAHVRNLKILVYKELGFEEVKVFPPVVIKQSSFWARLLWLLTGKI